MYRDEPILRTGAQAYGPRSASAREVPAPRASSASASESVSPVPVRKQQAVAPQTEGSTRALSLQEWAALQRELEKKVRTSMPAAYKKMRALERRQSGWGYSYSSGGAKLFYEQAKLMEDFEDDFDEACEFHQYYPTYAEMSDYQLRCYFGWRTRLRAGKITDAPLSFLFVHAYELLCGIGVTAGPDGFEALRSFASAYAGTSPAFDSHLARWQHDYVVFHGLDSSLATALQGSFPLHAIATIRRAEDQLLARGDGTWPERVSEGLPEPEELLDALCVVSRYRAERSRFVKAHKAEMAEVCAHVFARMVDHCKKRRKTGLVDGMFGPATRTSYTMYPSALFWTDTLHADTTFHVSDAESYVCERGFWWRVMPCRRTETNRELGNLLHTIDARMRKATGDAHPLKERTIPKYQTKLVDEEIARLVARKEAGEAARVRIDRASLKGIRSAAARTREALLTDEEREDEAAAMSPTPAVAPVPAVVPAVAPVTETSVPEASVPHADMLLALLEGAPLPITDSIQLSLAVDQINEVFLDIVGDVVIEYDGESPVLVEDYAEDVRAQIAV